MMSERCPKYFIEIRSRVRGDEQNFLAGISKPNGCGACHRRFADTTFASEEKVASCLF